MVSRRSHRNSVFDAGSKIARSQLPNSPFETAPATVWSGCRARPVVNRDQLIIFLAPGIRQLSHQQIGFPPDSGTGVGAESTDRLGTSKLRQRHRKREGILPGCFETAPMFFGVAALCSEADRRHRQNHAGPEARHGSIVFLSGGLTLCLCSSAKSGFSRSVGIESRELRARRWHSG